MSELIIIAVGLAMDAFAVAICKGLNMRKLDYKQTALIALFFGGFQAGMPLIGWFVGSKFAEYITSIDHWVTFILLAIIGGKMILEAIKDDDECEECGNNKLNLKELTALAIATSIDALAVGVAFALTYNRNTVFLAVALIGIITAGLSAIGVFIGHKFGAKYKNKAELAGGIILILMGAKILFEHLGILDYISISIQSFFEGYHITFGILE